MKGKKYLALLLILVIAFSAVAACARGEDPPESDPAPESSPVSTSTTTRLTTETLPEETSSPETGAITYPDPTSSGVPKTSEPQKTTQATSSKTTTLTLPSYTGTATLTLPSYTGTATLTLPSLTTKTEGTSVSTTPKTTAKNLSKEYEAIYKDYANRMAKKTPVLIKEYEKEAKDNRLGAVGLAAIQAQKVASLTRILTEGTAEMTALRVRTNGDAPDPEFDKWLEKLGQAYETELAKLRKAFD